MEIRIELPGVKLGVVEADGLHVVPVDLGLAKLMDEVSERKRNEFTVESLAEAESVRAVRAMFREWGMDPSKYRPSSEALLRRVVQARVFIASPMLWTSATSARLRPAGPTAATIARKLIRRSHCVTVPSAKNMKVS